MIGRDLQLDLDGTTIEIEWVASIYIGDQVAASDTMDYFLLLGDCPTVTPTTPVVTETTPVVTETTPVVTETTPVVTETTPVVTETTPVVTETTPVVTETTPVTPRPTRTPGPNDPTPTPTNTSPVIFQPTVTPGGPTLTPTATFTPTAIATLEQPAPVTGASSGTTAGDNSATAGEQELIPVGGADLASIAQLQAGLNLLQKVTMQLGLVFLGLALALHGLTRMSK